MGYHYGIVFCIDINNNVMQDIEQIKKTDVYPWRELYELWNQIVYNPLEKDFREDDIFYLDVVNAQIDDI